MIFLTPSFPNDLENIDNERRMDNKEKMIQLEKQVEDLTKENQLLKEMLSKIDNTNKNNNNNNNYNENKIAENKYHEEGNDNWMTVKHKGNIGKNNNIARFNSIDIRNRYQPICFIENEKEEYVISDDNIEVSLNKEQEIAAYNNLNKNVTKRRRTPTPFINQFPERDTLGKSFTNKRKNVVPGNTKFNEAVGFGRKAYVLGTSMVKGIRRIEFNSYLNKCSTRFRPFVGATLKQMETYVQPIINDDTPDVVILHIGCNDISDKNKSASDIAQGIINIGIYCKERNVNDVLISSLICRTQPNLQSKVSEVNKILLNTCKFYGLGYIDNSNIKVDLLVQDGLHLNEKGKIYLANNYINHMNKFVL